MILIFLLYSTFFFFSLGQIGRISFFGQQVNIYWYEIGITLIIIFLLNKYRLRPISECYRNLKVISIFFVYLFFSFLIGIFEYTAFENIVAFLYFLRLILYGVFAIYQIQWLRENDKNRKVFAKGLVIFVILTLLFSIIQYYFYPNLRNLIYVGWDPHLFRLFGTFLDTSVAGSIYGLLFIFIFLAKNRLISNKYLRLILLGFLLIFMVLTFSRNLYVSVLLTTGIILLLRKKFKEFVLLVSLFLGILFFIPKPSGEGVNLTRLFSVYSRVEDYKNALKMWQKKPLFGIGYNRIRYEKIRLNIIERVNSDISHSGASFHSSFLIMLATSGIIGLVFFLVILFKLVQINEFSKYGVIFLSLMSLSDNILLHPFLVFLAFALIAIYSFSPSRKLQ